MNFLTLDGDGSSATSYGVYISQVIRFDRASSEAYDFNNRNIFLTAKRLRQGYSYHKLRKSFLFFFLLFYFYLFIFFYYYYYFFSVLSASF